MSLEDKIEFLEKLNFDYLFVLRFNHQLASKEPRQFIDEFIIKPKSSMLFVVLIFILEIMVVAIVFI